MTREHYKAAGVDIAAGNEAVSRMKAAVESTFSHRVLTPIGSFGAMYDLQFLKQYDHPVLVQSIDGVGTKMMVAKMMGAYQTIGRDLVSATANDIIVMGATPLTLLDYIANDQLNPAIIEDIMAGMSAACRENNIALIGGETAEMPGTYLSGEHDLVGVITGVVEKEKAILGKDICVGDVILALPSSGLHTNGYSLARHLLFKKHGFQVDDYVEELSQSIGEALLTPHVNYTLPVLKLLAEGTRIHGMAHITGGGLLENIPRILPDGTSVEINLSQLPRLPIFSWLQTLGNLAQAELYRTFNMGVGLILIVPPTSVNSIRETLASFPELPLLTIGEVIASNEKSVRLLS